MDRGLVLAVLVSGEGGTLDALAEATSGGHVPGRIGLVVADRPHAPAIEKARQRGLPTLVLPYRGQEPDAWGRQLTAALRERGTELVVLAGFLAILPSGFVRDWDGRAVNVHPSLLPRYGGPGMYGRRVHEAVLRAHEPFTGATVHLVTDDVDSGPILAQERIEVRANDTAQTLRERIRPVERRLLFDVLRGFSDGTLPLPYPAAPDPAAQRDRPGTVP
jgi:phosphoribosylglycinamide formyltransferase-1